MANIVNKNKDGYGYRYTDISEIHRYLEENNMSYYQYIDRIDGDDYIMTVKIVDGKEQPAIRGSRVVQATLSGIKNPAQEQGSALTYARRYSLLMAFGLATDDDDAQSLSRPEITTEKEALEYKLTFGKFKGKTLQEVAEENEWYITSYLLAEGDDTIKSALKLMGYEEKTEKDVLNMPIQESQKNRIKDEVDTETIKMYLKTVGKSKLSELTYFEAEELLK